MMWRKEIRYFADNRCADVCVRLLGFVNGVKAWSSLMGVQLKDSVHRIDSLPRSGNTDSIQYFQ
jgi:hypothetical protein